MKIIRMFVFFLFLNLFLSVATCGEERPELEVREKGGVWIEKISYDIVASDDKIIVAYSLTIKNSEDGIDSNSISFDILSQSGEIEELAFYDLKGNRMDYEDSCVGNRYLLDVTLNEILPPGESFTLEGGYWIFGCLESNGNKITTRVPLLVPVVKECTGTTKISISMKSPEGYKCTHAIPQPTKKTIEGNRGVSKWEMKMVPPSILFVTHKPIEATTISPNDIIIVGIAIWILIVAFYAYKKLR